MSRRRRSYASLAKSRTIHRRGCSPWRDVSRSITAARAFGASDSRQARGGSRRTTPRTPPTMPCCAMNGSPRCGVCSKRSARGTATFCCCITLALHTARSRNVWAWRARRWGRCWRGRTGDLWPATEVHTKHLRRQPMSDHPLDPAPRDGWRRLLTAHLSTHLSTHLRAGQIREYLDGEVRGLTALRYGLHLTICSRCAERRRSVKARGHAVAALLEMAGSRPPRFRSRVVSVPAIGFVAIAALSAATAGILVSYGPFVRPRLLAQAQIKDVCCF